MNRFCLTCHRELSVQPRLGEKVFDSDRTDQLTAGSGPKTWLHFIVSLIRKSL